MLQSSTKLPKLLSLASHAGVLQNGIIGIGGWQGDLHFIDMGHCPSPTFYGQKLVNS